MLVESLGLPIKKSAEAIKLYQKYGPYFNEALWYMYQSVLNCSDKINITERLFTDECLAIANRIRSQWTLETISYPFEHQTNYLGEKFRDAICISINDVVAHGRARPTYKDNLGDICSIDCGLVFNSADGLRFDSGFTTRLGQKKLKEDDWINTPHMALKEIIANQPKDTMEIAEIIYSVAKTHDLNVVASLCGHGIGRKLHEAPFIHNAPGSFRPVKLFDGLCFCAEPIFVKPSVAKEGSDIESTHIGEDGWEVRTVSRNPASHFETMFGVINGQIVDLIGVTEWEL